MKHFILKNEIIITLIIKKGGGWKLQLSMLFVFKLKHSSHMERISNDIFYKTKNTGDFK